MAENYWDNLMGTDEGAANYMASYGEGPGFETRKFIASHLKPGESVLDVGCGPGWNFDHLEKYGPSVKYRGVDYSPRFIRVASERVKPMKIFSVGDARHLDAPDRSFDTIILQDILEHTNGFEKPVYEALRVAKKQVIISFWHLTMDDDHINENKEENDMDGWGAWYSRPTWEKFLNSMHYSWMHHPMTVEGKTHKWDFYIIFKDGR